MAQSSNSGNGILVSGLTIMFVYLKLTKQIDWSWLWVLSPCWIVGFIWAWIES